jgi:hypothetical protein
VNELDPIAIIAPAPARKRRFANAEQALAYYNAVGVQSREDLIVLAELCREELQKIHNIFDEVFARCAEAKAAEDAAQQPEQPMEA